jgi:peptidoglycan-N-acetylglucosamine deacetylase
VRQGSRLRQLAKRGLALAAPRRLFMTSGPAGCGAVALTFDDGPHPDHTPPVLDRLRALGVRATFFVVGARAEAHPALLRRIVAEGHELGHHSWAHERPRQASATALLEEARRTARLIEAVVGRRPHLFRPPYGELSAHALLGLWRQRQTVVLWSRDPKDFRGAPPGALERWCRATPLTDGDIVLLHDSHEGLLPALDALVARATELGLVFTTPSVWV